MHEIVICTKLNSYVRLMLYSWSFGKNKSVKIAIEHNKYYLSFDIYTTLFDWDDRNPNRNMPYIF